MALKFFLILMPIMFSCSVGKPNIKNSLRPTIDDIRLKSQGHGKITLLEHQLVPIDYLHKNPDIRGILVNHYMGTGKTYLGIGMAESFPGHPVLILAPRFLESHWLNEIELYGVSDPKRYKFVSYDDAPKKLISGDFSNHILLADEVHNLVKHMRSSDSESNALYTQVYMNLRNAYKILGLTGTPLYGDESDVAFVMNFVSGENLMPFNQESFRLAYTKIIPDRQFFRGFFTESNLVVAMLPITLGIFTAAILGPVAGLVGGALGILAPVTANYIWDLEEYKLRELNVPKMLGFMNKYVSFFKFSDSHFKDFPAQDFKVMQVPYNRQQYSFFLRLVEGDLPVDQLQRLLKNDRVTRSNEFVRINSSVIHEQFYSTVGAGRDIGNFEFTDDAGQVIEAPKFMRIYEEITKDDDQTVVYSNYYQTGIIAFKDFLIRQGYKEKYALIEPSMPVQKVKEAVDGYNQGKIKLLMLHPDITEGISLKGTQKLHLLEPLLNSTVLEQVVGRTRRFQSHNHLPKNKQLVHVRMWQSSSSSWNPDIGDLKRANWHKRYRELAYMARWGIGITQIDKKHDLKALNPEELAFIKLKTLEKNLISMQKLLSSESIEKSYRQ